jgi:hypothetical protein
MNAVAMALAPRNMERAPAPSLARPNRDWRARDHTTGVPPPATLGGYAQALLFGASISASKTLTSFQFGLFSLMN